MKHKYLKSLVIQEVLMEAPVQYHFYIKLEKGGREAGRKEGRGKETDFKTPKFQAFNNPDTFVSLTGKNVNCYYSYAKHFDNVYTSY